MEKYILKDIDFILSEQLPSNIFRCRTHECKIGYTTKVSTCAQTNHRSEVDFKLQIVRTSNSLLYNRYIRPR